MTKLGGTRIIKIIMVLFVITVIALKPVFAAANDIQLYFGIQRSFAAELDIDCENYAIYLWGNNYSKPSPAPVVSVTDIRVEQALLGFGYYHSFNPTFSAEVGARHKYHTQTGNVTKIDERGKTVLVPVTLKDSARFTPYVALGFDQPLGAIGISGYGAADLDGIDALLSVYYSLGNGYRLAAGYKHWAMNEWYSGFFIGLGLVR